MPTRWEDFDDDPELDLIFVSCAHPPSEIGDSNEEALEMEMNDWRKSDLRRADLSHLPVTYEHEGDIGVGKVLFSHNAPSGAKLTTAVVACDTPAGRHTARAIESGELPYVSLSHMYRENYPGNGIIRQVRQPHRLGITKNPNREGCHILRDSLQRVERKTWDPNRDWPNIRFTHQGNSQTLEEADSNTTMEDASGATAPGTETAATPRVPPAELLQRMATGDFGKGDPDLMKEALQALSAEKLQTQQELTKLREEVNQLSQQNSQLSEKNTNFEGFTRERLSEAIAKAQALADTKAKLMARLAALDEVDAEGKAEGQEASGDDALEGHDAGAQFQGLQDDLLDKFTPEQMPTLGRIFEIACHNSQNDVFFLQRMEQEKKMQRAFAMKEQHAMRAGAAGYEQMYDSQHTPAGVPTGVLGAPQGRFGPSSVPGGGDHNPRPPKRGRTAEPDSADGHVPEPQQPATSYRDEHTARLAQSKWNDW